jgi:HSP20 family molecular chaperone IbpA
MSIFNQFVRNPAEPSGCAGQNNGDAAREAEFTVKPVHEIKETPEAWSLTVQLPGVARDSLEISAEENVITFRGRRSWRQPETWTSLYRESADAPYLLVLQHGNNVDVEKIQADLKDGILTVSLPKTEAVKPRKIVIN